MHLAGERAGGHALGCGVDRDRVDPIRVRGELAHLGPIADRVLPRGLVGRAAKDVLRRDVDAVDVVAIAADLRQLLAVGRVPDVNLAVAAGGESTAITVIVPLSRLLAAAPSVTCTVTERVIVSGSSLLFS